jgi:hypothetical protein
MIAEVREEVADLAGVSTDYYTRSNAAKPASLPSSLSRLSLSIGQQADSAARIRRHPR